MDLDDGEGQGHTKDVSVAQRTALRMVGQPGGEDVVLHGGATRRTGAARRMGTTLLSMVQPRPSARDGGH